MGFDAIDQYNSQEPLEVEYYEIGLFFGCKNCRLCRIYTVDVRLEAIKIVIVVKTFSRTLITS